MKKRVAINGMGRIGRLAFRALLDSDTMEIAAVNDVAPIDVIAYLVRHDSEHGPLAAPHTVASGNAVLMVDGREVPAFQSEGIEGLPWGDLGIDLVLECTGAFNSREKASRHLDAGAGRVLVSAAAGRDVPTVVYGINEDIVGDEDRIVSGASCSTVASCI